MKFILETERLRLREFTLNDTAFIIELLNSPGWLQFIGDRKVKTHDDAKKYLYNGPMRSYKLNGYGLYLVQNKSNGLSIGMCGILKRDTLDTPDIGFAFLPKYMGNGYAYEIAHATLMHAKNKLKIPRISAITLPANERSIRLLEKMGLKKIDTISFPQENEELCLYST